MASAFENRLRRTIEMAGTDGQTGPVPVMATLSDGGNTYLVGDVDVTQELVATGPGGANTNLSITSTAADVTVVSSTGNDGTIPAATATAAGVATAAQITKLNGIAVGATANATDAQLRDRATHTGTQAIGTVAGLQTALDAKQGGLISGTNIKTVNGESILGSGNLVIAGGATVQPHATDITYDGTGRVTGWTSGSDVYVVTYGANGLSAITKNGQAHITANYTAGKIVSFNWVQGGGETVVIDWIPGLGQVATVSQNTLAAINPASDPLANPNYPATPPWERTAAWTHCLDFGSVIMCDDIGTHGTIMFYAAAGHSACNPTMWVGYDLAQRTWRRVGRRTLPNDDMHLGLEAYPGLLDPVWGDYIGSAAGWGAFAQPGYNPPAGSHAYGGLTYRPAAKAGNAGGQILYPLNATGGTAGNASRGSWIWDADTELFERSANLRPAAGGATVGGTEYFESIDSAFALNTANSTWLMTLDWFDWSSKTWTRRNSQTTLYNVGLSGLSLAHQSASLYIICDVNGGAIKLYAAPVDKVAAGTAWAWSELTVVNSSGDAIPTVAWVWHDTKQCYYGAGYQPSQGHYLYKLTTPGTTQAQCLSGAWTITRETIAGEALVFLNGNGTSTGFNNLGFLTYSRKLDCLFWMSNYVGGPVQALQPGV